MALRKKHQIQDTDTGPSKSSKSRNLGIGFTLTHFYMLLKVIRKNNPTSLLSMAIIVYQ